jgi:hypothetical protein
MALAFKNSALARVPLEIWELIFFAGLERNKPVSAFNMMPLFYAFPLLLEWFSPKDNPTFWARVNKMCPDRRAFNAEHIRLAIWGQNHLQLCWACGGWKCFDAVMGIDLLRQAIATNQLAFVAITLHATGLQEYRGQLPRQLLDELARASPQIFRFVTEMFKPTRKGHFSVVYLQHCERLALAAGRKENATALKCLRETEEAHQAKKRAKKL